MPLLNLGISCQLEDVYGMEYTFSMMSRSLKRTVIATVFIIGLGLIFYSYRLFTVPVSDCFDGLKNGEEDGADCGIAACGVSCGEEVAPLSVISAKLIQINGGDYDFIAQIKNPHQDLGSPEAVYELKIFDAENREVLKKTGVFYILPDQTRFLIISALKNQAAVRAEFKIQSAIWQKLESFEGINFPVLRKEYSASSDSGSSVFFGVVLNDSDFDFALLDIEILLSDKNDNIVGANMTDVRSIRSREERYFESMWLSPIGEVKEVRVQAYTNLFENSNFIKQYGSGQEKFQQY